MKYLIMECHPGYAVAMTEEGTFLKVANLNYEVGQEVEQVIAARPPRRRGGGWLRLLPVCACLCLAFWGAWYFVLSSFGTVRMRINPEVLISVNRLGYVVELEGLNDDGDRLADGVDTFGRKLEQVSGDLADRARVLGYLPEEGEIVLTVRSGSETWNSSTEALLTRTLEERLDGCRVTAGDGTQPPAEPEKTPLQPEDDDHDDHDDHNHDDEDGEED